MIVHVSCTANFFSSGTGERERLFSSHVRQTHSVDGFETALFRKNSRSVCEER